ncbi:MAG TPA: hypothetical protein VLV83_09225 [Acidobacteriota bacterium]|nr:hypothetical protein [Acidobacteriota bacterium]
MQHSKPKNRRTAGRALRISLCLVLLLPIVAGSVLPKQQLSREEMALDEFVHLLNGTWILEQRFSPDGELHPQPLQGRMEIHLSRQPTKMLGPRALGHLTSLETGIWDPKLEAGVPAEILGKPFFFETTGLWEVTVDQDRLECVGGEGMFFRVSQANTMRGNFAPFVKGLLSTADLRLTLTPPEDENIPSPSLKLSQAVSLTQPDAFRGRFMPKEWSKPVNLWNAAVPGQELTRSPRTYREFSVTGQQLTVTWEGGMRDVWKRQP